MGLERHAIAIRDIDLTFQISVFNILDFVTRKVQKLQVKKHGKFFFQAFWAFTIAPTYQGLQWLLASTIELLK